MSIWRFLFGLLSSGRIGPSLTILIFHRVLAAKDPLMPCEPDATEFERKMRWVAECFRVMPLEDAAVALARGKLPKRAVAITFDDGYADNVLVAVPILERLGLPATVFVATGFLDGGRMWNDTVIESVRRAAGDQLNLDALGLGIHSIQTDTERIGAIDRLLTVLKYRRSSERHAMAEGIAECAEATMPPSPMLTSDQVLELYRRGFSIGAHTCTHPILARLDNDSAWEEIRNSKLRLEEIVGTSVSLFAYPNGRPGQDYGEEHVRMVREAGYKAAVSTAPGASAAAEELFELRRFTPWDHGRFAFQLRLARNLFVRD